jgi:enamine deaminase RidA (YjgF/YER057c/UK114 family)
MSCTRRRPHSVRCKTCRFHHSVESEPARNALVLHTATLSIGRALTGPPPIPGDPVGTPHCPGVTASPCLQLSIRVSRRPRRRSTVRCGRGNMIYTAQVPRYPKIGKMTDGDIKVQMRQTLTNLKQAIEAGGGKLRYYGTNATSRLNGRRLSWRHETTEHLRKARGCAPGRWRFTG